MGELFGKTNIGSFVKTKLLECFVFGVRGMAGDVTRNIYLCVCLYFTKIFLHKEENTLNLEFI